MYDEKTKAKLQTNKDYYYILGVRPDATTEEIGEAYLDLHEKFGPHVSVSGMDPDILIRTYNDISDAYEVLMDPAKRREYDKASIDKRQSSSELRALLVRRPSQTPQSNTSASGTGNVPVVGAVEHHSMPKITALAMEMEVEVTLKEAIKGTMRELHIADPHPCDACAHKVNSRTPCQKCHGMGYLKSERKQNVSLPAGLYHDMQLTLANQGRYDMRAGRNGDLLVKVKLKPHHCLSVLGRDITVTVPVTIYEAVLGAEIEVPCATGKVVMKIQPLTQPGRVYRLKGMGLAGADQLVTIDVVMPQTLSGEEVALFRKLKELSKEANPRDSLFRTPN